MREIRYVPLKNLAPVEEMEKYDGFETTFVAFDLYCKDRHLPICDRIEDSSFVDGFRYEQIETTTYDIKKAKISL